MYSPSKAQQSNLTLQRFVIEEEMMEEDSDRIEDSAKEIYRHNLKCQLAGNSREEGPPRLNFGPI